MQVSLNKCLSNAGVRMRDARGPRMVPTNSDPDTVEKILSSLWMNVVKPVLEGLAYSVSAALNVCM